MSHLVLKKILDLFKKEHPGFNFKNIEQIIKYKFKDKTLLLKAFKHRSYLSITKEDQSESNERLEFLGDAILDHATTIFLFKLHPDKTEGRLSQMKSVLVSRPVLAEACIKLEVGKFLLIDKGEEKTGGRNRKSNLSNLFEALIGAIYLDGGYVPAEKFINSTLLEFSESILRKKRYLNYKSILLEYSQSKGMGSPVYEIISETGPDHEKSFVIKVSLNNKNTANGKGQSKKYAEQDAARKLLLSIKPNLIE